MLRVDLRGMILQHCLLFIQVVEDNRDLILAVHSGFQGGVHVVNNSTSHAKRKGIKKCVMVALKKRSGYHSGIQVEEEKGKRDREGRGKGVSRRGSLDFPFDTRCLQNPLTSKAKTWQSIPAYEAINLD